MAWRRPGNKPLSEPMMVILPTHIPNIKIVSVNLEDSMKLTSSLVSCVLFLNTRIIADKDANWHVVSKFLFAGKIFPRPDNIPECKHPVANVKRLIKLRNYFFFFNGWIGKSFIALSNGIVLLNGPTSFNPLALNLRVVGSEYRSMTPYCRYAWHCMVNLVLNCPDSQWAYMTLHYQDCGRGRDTAANICDPWIFTLQVGHHTLLNTREAASKQHPAFSPSGGLLISPCVSVKPIMTSLNISP